MEREKLHWTDRMAVVIESKCHYAIGLIDRLAKSLLPIILVVLGLVLASYIKTDPFVLVRVVFYLISLMFIFAGGLISLTRLYNND